MRWRLAVAAPRTRWLVNAGWGFVWSLGYASVTLIPLEVHGYRWWLPIVGFSVLVAVSTAALTAWLERGVVASYAAVLDGLSGDQRRQVARVWRRGPVPTDSGVLIAVLRLHGLLERYREGSQRRRVTGAVLVGLGTVGLVVAAVADRQAVSPSAVIFVVLGVWMVAAPGAAALRARRRQPRLAALRAAAQADAAVAAAVARPAVPAAPLTRARRVRGSLAALLLVVVYVAALQVATVLSPHRTACRAVNAVVSENYRDRDSLFGGDALGPSGPPLSTYQDWSNLLRRKAAEADDDPQTAMYLHGIAVYASQMMGVVERARQPDQAGDATAYSDNQRAYLTISQALITEVGYAQEQCRQWGSRPTSRGRLA